MNSSVADAFVSEESVTLPPISSSLVTSHIFFYWHWYYAVYLFLAWQLAVVFWSFWWKAPVSIQANLAPFIPALTRCPVQHHYRGVSNAVWKVVDSITYARCLGNSCSKGIRLRTRSIYACLETSNVPSLMESLSRFRCPIAGSFSYRTVMRSNCWKMNPSPCCQWKKPCTKYGPKPRMAFARRYQNLAKSYQLAFTESILGHHQVPPEHKGPKSESFRVTVGVLKNKLRSNIPGMSGAIQKRIRDAVALEVVPPTGICV